MGNHRRGTDNRDTCMRRGREGQLGTLDSRRTHCLDCNTGRIDGERGSALNQEQGEESVIVAPKRQWLVERTRRRHFPLTRPNTR
jgi:hypothetical protein